jgi:hypothetical protein
MKYFFCFIVPLITHAHAQEEKSDNNNHPKLKQFIEEPAGENCVSTAIEVPLKSCVFWMPKKTRNRRVCFAASKYY